jgi:hypothetical protein
VFPLAGLAGLPFTGKTGWAAFSSHLVEDGNIVILYAPHVGIDNDGIIGQVMREGQSHPSGACGAAIGAQRALCLDETASGFHQGYKDLQMDTIKFLLSPHYQ